MTTKIENKNKQNPIVVIDEIHTLTLECITLNLRLDKETQERYDKDPEFRTEVSKKLKAYWLAKRNLLRMGIEEFNIQEL